MKGFIGKFLMLVSSIFAFGTYVFSIYFAYVLKGTVAALLTAFLPGLGQMYWIPSAFALAKVQDWNFYSLGSLYIMLLAVLVSLFFLMHLWASLVDENYEAE